MKKQLSSFVLALVFVGGVIPVFAQQDQCTDYAPHTAHMVEVASDVELEVMDWEAEGKVLVFLSGLGGTAHTYDELINHFWPQYRVLSITRRGFGQSTYSEEGYDAATRAKDIVAVLDYFDIEKATLIGHSIAGDELSKFGAAYSGRVEGLIYLDAYDYGGGAIMRLMQEFPMPAPTTIPTAVDSSSIRHLQAFYVRAGGVRPPLSELCSIVELDSDGRVKGSRTAMHASMKIMTGTHDAEFEKITAPVLAIFAVGDSKYWQALDYADRTEAEQAQIDRALEAGAEFRKDQIEAYRSKLKNITMVEIPGASHHVYISHESLVVREIMKFLE